MKIRIRGIRSRGDLDKERVVVEALEDGQIGQHVVASTQRLAKGVSSAIKFPFWIPDNEVKKGDLIIIYTKGGTFNSRVNDGGESSYFHYMGLAEPVYGKSDTTAVILNVGRWIVAPAENLTENDRE